MRLVPKVDGAIDRYDRAIWLTPPFDMSVAAIVTPTVFDLPTVEPLFPMVTPPGPIRGLPDAERVLMRIYQSMWKLEGITGTLNLYTGAVSGKLKTLTIEAGLITGFTKEP